MLLTSPNIGIPDDLQQPKRGRRVEHKNFTNASDVAEAAVGLD